MAGSLLAVCVAIACLATTVNSVSFFMEPGTVKCFSDTQISKDTLVTGEYVVSEAAAAQKMRIQVLDTANHILYKNDDARKGKFAITTSENNYYEVCFKDNSPGQGAVRREVSINIKHGTEAKAYQNLAQAEKLKPIELAMRRLEDMADEIVSSFAYFREREEEQRNTNNSTNTRVVLFSLLSVLCLVALAIGQLVYLKQFFVSKKLIES
ncbi:transmembrane emp24 domain-containing protein 10 isoform X1 [Nematostella vectensis]|uniref:transmembrane emp24 domain-containing protein 10 isoform X1 n=1 Tax=Nematostella vectensis TaxID=45351 RepID=UPI0020772C53|nr:transmembrane emp24 domain-containing protein 10 isoform X1 [Nematostella vectensis]